MPDVLYRLRGQLLEEDVAPLVTRSLTNLEVVDRWTMVFVRRYRGPSRENIFRGLLSVIALGDRKKMPTGIWFCLGKQSSH